MLYKSLICRALKIVVVKIIAGNNAIQANKALNLSGNGKPIWKDYRQTFMALQEK